MEECLFRAVPLSLAALIGARFGHRGLAVAIAVVVQALVFGAAHANYPGFPSYSRLVELFLPAVVWALIFLRFGLIPTILLHATFDLTLMSIPLFLLNSPGAIASRGLVIAVGLVPLLVLLGRRLARGSWGELPSSLRNGAWHPPVAEAPPAPPPRVVTRAEIAGRTAAFQRALPVLGVAGLIVWALATPFRADVPPLAVSRAEAEATAAAALAARGVTLGPGWRRTAVVRLATDDPSWWEGHKFVWREAGPAAYAKLIGKTLVPPMWEIRYALFEGDVAERAEEWRVTVDDTGAVRQIRHTLPESRPGARLTRDEALTLARKALKERLGLDPATLKDVGSDETELPARADWSFTFADPSVDVGPGGEAHVVVAIAGDEVVAYGRYVRVPEAWQRAESERDGKTLFVRLALAGLLVVAGLVALVMAVVDWTHHRRDARALVGVTATAFVLSAIGVANAWPVMAMSFVTTEPIATQATSMVAASLAGALVAALLLGLAAGVGVHAAARVPRFTLATRLPAWVAGAASACFVAGVSAVAVRLLPRSAPLWPASGVDSLALPWLGAALVGARTLYAIGVALFLLHWFAQLTGNWRRRLWVTACIAVAIFATLDVAGASDPLLAGAAGALSGAALIVVVYALLRFEPLTVPAFVAAGAILEFAEAAARKGEPGALVNAAIASVVAIAVAWLATRYLERARETVAVTEAPPPAAT